MTNPDTMTIQQIADMYDLHPNTIRRAMDSETNPLLPNHLLSSRANHYVFDNIEVVRWHSARKSRMKHLISEDSEFEDDNV